MNSVLNIQLFEQLTLINETASSTMDSYCQQIYQVLQSEVEPFDSLSYYRRRGNTFVQQLHLPESDISDPITADAQPDLWSALMKNGHYVDGDDIYLPLHSDQVSFALIKLCFTEETDIAWSVVYRILLNQAQTIFTRNILEQEEQIVAAQSTATTFSEIVLAIAKHTAQAGQFVSLSLIEVEGKKTQFGQLAASANRQKAYENLFGFGGTKDDHEYLFEQLRAQPLFYLQTHDDPNLSQEMRDWFAKSNVYATMMAGIFIRDSLVAFIAFNDTTYRLHLTPLEDHLWRTIATHTAQILAMRQLLEASTYSHDLSNMQAEVLNAIHVDMSFDDMALTIARHMLPQQGRFVAINKFLHDQEGNIIDWEFVASANRNQIMTEQDKTPFAWMDISEDIRQRISNGDVIAIADISEFVAPKVKAFYTQNGVKSLHSFPIVSNGRIVALLTMLNRNRNEFLREEESAFLSISRQIGAIISLQASIDETQQIRQTLQSMIDTNHQISLASNDAEIAKLLFKSLPDSVTHIAMYHLKKPVNRHQSPTMVDMTVIADRQSESPINKQITFDPTSPFTTELTDKLLDGEFVVINDMGGANNPLPAMLVKSLKVASIRVCIMGGIQVNEQLLGLIVFGSDDITAQSIDTQFLHNSRILADQIAINYENRNLLLNAEDTLSQLRDQFHTQQLLNELATFLSTSPDEKLLLDKGAETLLEMLPVDHVGIMLLNEEGTYANLISDIPPRETSVRHIPVEPRIAEQLEKDRQVIIENVRTDQMQDASRQSLEAIGVQSTIILPLINLSGKMVGSVGLDKLASTISLTNEQIQMAQLVNSQLSSQLQNLWSVRDSQRFANQMQQIAKYGETVQSRLELSEILQTTLHFVERIVKADYYNIVIYDNDLQKLTIRAYRQQGKDTIPTSDYPIMPVDNTAVGAVWRNREPIYISNLEDSPYIHPFAKDIKSLYATALISQGVTRGAIEVGKVDAQGISSIDRSVLQQLANQLAVALENATTYIQGQRLAQNKVLANDIALQLQQQMDIDGLLNTTVTELGKALGAKRARIRLGIQQTVEEN